MIKFLGKIPKKIIVACSGGPDSMAVLDFLRNGKHDVEIAFFNHRTETSYRSLVVVENYAKTYNIKCHFGILAGDCEKHESQEMFWRRKRYEFFRSISGEDLIITCHHADDQIENWLMTSIKGMPHLIPYSNNRIIRPFLISCKNDLIQWCERKNVSYLDDPSNFDRKYKRNIVRHDIIPHALKINPGIEKTIIKLTKEEYNIKNEDL
jgi:tRNA(Ile)-lysidine synthetase-like protein